jgi:hypothetical protein
VRAITIQERGNEHLIAFVQETRIGIGVRLNVKHMPEAHALHCSCMLYAVNGNKKVHIIKKHYYKAPVMYLPLIFSASNGVVFTET